MDNHDIANLIDNYTPASLTADDWQAVCTDVRAWVHAAGPGHPHRARQLLAAAAQLAAWCREAGIPLRPDTALKATTIERYCAVAERARRHSATTRATIRARLRCLARVQHIHGQPPPPPEIRRGRVKPPYTAAEVASFFLLVRGQSEPTATRLSALLLAGLGAGCGSEELRDLRGTDIRRAADGTVLAHLRGRQQRTVPVVSSYADRLADIAERSGDAILIGGAKADRRAVASGLLHRLHGVDSLTPLEPGRLRSTWIAGRLIACVRLDVLMQAAGLTTPTTIVDLAASLPAFPIDLAHRQLRADQPPDAVDARRTHEFDGVARRDCPPELASDGRGA
ncbi:MAG: hypothetical protein JJT89_04855 [Nitriliruptoraceae bacterium]|nr:hypothetical protein [Nitriliruptoraceae bacterium]